MQEIVGLVAGLARLRQGFLQSELGLHSGEHDRP
jgi:hypothetical protein